MLGLWADPPTHAHMQLRRPWAWRGAPTVPTRRCLLSRYLLTVVFQGSCLILTVPKRLGDVCGDEWGRVRLHPTGLGEGIRNKYL